MKEIITFSTTNGFNLNCKKFLNLLSLKEDFIQIFINLKLELSLSNAFTDKNHDIKLQHMIYN